MLCEASANEEVHAKVLDSPRPTLDQGFPPTKPLLDDKLSETMLKQYHKTMTEALEDPKYACVGKITILKESVVELCSGCNKVKSCLFQMVQQSELQFKFCSADCFKSSIKDGRSIPLMNTCPGGGTSVCKERYCIQQHDEDLEIVAMTIDVNVEIQTLSAEYQDGGNLEPNEGAAKANDTAALGKNAQPFLCCCFCKKSLQDQTINSLLSWEAMDYCSDKCLRWYIMKVVGAHCSACISRIAVDDTILGKMCVRFGRTVRQFCSSICLGRFKRNRKLCPQCGTDIPPQINFCSSACFKLENRLRDPSAFLGTGRCFICAELKPIVTEVLLTGQSYWLCSEDCRVALCTSRKLTTLKCGICCRHFDVRESSRFVVRNYGGSSTALDSFCSATCLATNLLRNRRIEKCRNCPIKKYTNDMIGKPTGKASVPADGGSPVIEMAFYCSLGCCRGAAPSPGPSATPRSDASLRTPSLHGVTGGKVSHKTAARRPVRPPASTATTASLAHRLLQAYPAKKINRGPPAPSVVLKDLRTIGVKAPPSSPQVPPGGTRGVQNTSGCFIPLSPSPPVQQQPLPAVSPVQGAESPFRRPPILVCLPEQNVADIPVSVQHKVIFVPPQVKEMKNKSTWIDSPPIASFKGDNKSPKSDDPLRIPIFVPIPIPVFFPIPMAMSDSSVPYPAQIQLPVPFDPSVFGQMIPTIRNGKEDSDGSRASSVGILEEFSSLQDPLASQDEKSMDDSCSQLGDALETSLSSSEDSTGAATRGNGYFGNKLGSVAWAQWLARFPDSLAKFCEKLSLMSLPNMNDNLISFVRYTRKPDGDVHRPDVLLFLIYGLQLGLVEVGRRDVNLLMDAALEPFQLELDAHLKPFYDCLLDVMSHKTGDPKRSNSSFITTSLEESDLWKSHQLGVHSPIVLVFTVLYLNVKHLGLYKVEQHEQLQFAQVLEAFGIQKDLVGFVAEPPGSCPIKNVSFYLAKCPESVRCDGPFPYLIPESSNRPDSPTWYSSQPLPRPLLARMLRRVILVKEILCVLMRP